MKTFKIRASAASNIIAGEIGITEKQEIKLQGFINKPKLTAIQETEMNNLLHKKNNPELPQGAKTYCKDWLKGQLLDYVHEFSSKYTDKGDIMEDESIDFIADNLGYGFLIKNEEHFSNEFMQGTPDIIMNDLVIDVKNSWDASTFPMFENEIPNSDYYWQLQVYMALTDKSKAKLIYCLMNTPEHLIFRDARWYSISKGHEELDKDIYDKFVKNLTYSNITPSYRIKSFDIERSESDIQKIKDRVIMCRSYISHLISTLPF